MLRYNSNDYPFKFSCEVQYLESRRFQYQNFLSVCRYSLNGRRATKISISFGDTMLSIYIQKPNQLRRGGTLPYNHKGVIIDGVGLCRTNSYKKMPLRFTTKENKVEKPKECS